MPGCAGRRRPTRRRRLGVLRGERLGDALQRLALGLDAEERRDDATDDHQRGADEVADRQPVMSLLSDALSMSLPNSSGPLMPPTAVPIA